MTCRELADFIADYISGDISGEVRTRFDRHLALCPNCRRYLENYRATIALGKRAFEDADTEVGTDVPEELIRAILEVRRR